MVRLDPWRLQETFSMLDQEWKEWMEGKTSGTMSESELMEFFLDVAKGFGSSIDVAYIDEWHRQQKEKKQ